MDKRVMEKKGDYIGRNGGCHRNEHFDNCKKQVPVIFSTDTEEDFRYMIEHNEN